MKKAITPYTLGLLFLLSGIFCAGGLVLAAPTTRMSVGMQPNRYSQHDEAISADGRFVVFHSSSSNITPLDFNGVDDVFVRDRWTAQTERVSVASDGTEGNGGSSSGAISADGRHVVFSSWASNLVEGDTNGTHDVFVHDRLTGLTERVNVATDGVQADAVTLVAAISPDGQYVGYHTTATTLVPGDTNGASDVFVYDRKTGETDRVSVASDGTESNGHSYHPCFSQDGRYVGFESDATNLVLGDTNDRRDVFIHDRETGETQRVSLTGSGAQADGLCWDVSLSADGRYVAYTARAANLVVGDTNEIDDIIVVDTDTGQPERVSVASDGSEGNARSWCPEISADGRYVVFCSEATNLVTGGTKGTQDVFLHDRQTGETQLVSVDDSGADVLGNSRWPRMSPDARYVLFESDSPGLAPGDMNDVLDVFVRDLQDGRTEMISWAHAGSQVEDASDLPVMSANGQCVAFASVATTLGETPDTNGVADVFVRDSETGWTERISVAMDGSDPDGESNRPSMSADARYVAFHSHATNLVADDTNATSDVFVHDRETGGITRVSVASGGGQATGWSEAASISAGGRYVAFESLATDLVSGDSNGLKDIFRHDRDTGDTARVNVADDGTQANAGSGRASISASGRYTAFESNASNLVADDMNGVADIFVHDWETGETERVSVDSDGTEADGGSSDATISDDGRYVVFSSNATNLVAGDTNASKDIFVHDRETGETERVSVASGGVQVTGNSEGGSISSDGRYVVFCSVAADLVPDDTNGVEDVFLHDRLANWTERVSVGAGGVQGDRASSQPDLGADGRYVVFASYASNLVDEDTNWSWDVFRRERPVADFSADSTSGDAPFTVSFTDLSSGIPNSWQWDFGDGTTSTEQLPSHEYLSSGSFTVTLTVSDGAGSSTSTKQDYITVNLSPPVANFSASPTSGATPLIVDFADLSTGEAASWSWDFGDGGTAGEQSPSHQYENVGTYTVSLTASNAVGSDTETKADYVSVFFPDVDEDYWACDAILACVDAGIVGGYGDGTYHPEWPVDRGQMAVYIARAVAGGDDYVPDGPATPTFVDVPSTGYGESGAEPYWAYKYIEYAVGQNVIQGYEHEDPEHAGETVFYYRPLWTVTRDQMAVYIARAMVAPSGEAALDDYVPADPRNFPDVPNTGCGDTGTDPYWAYTHIEYCVENGVVQGYEDGNYYPYNVVTRDQMAVYVARAFDLVP